MDGFAYIPGELIENPLPLSRFLPRVPIGIVSTFLSHHTSTSDWIFDPFGAAPILNVESARAGKNVLVAVNNPISRFLHEIAAAPPTVDELRTALSRLATLRKGQERLETHLQSLYVTICNQCQREIPAEAYIWEKGTPGPSGRIYHCPCGKSGEFHATDDDKSRAEQIAAHDALHRSRALERVTSPGDPTRKHAEQALNCYQPRAIYALVTLVNKVEPLRDSLPREIYRAMITLLVAACDDGNSLWDHPTERARPKQMHISQRYLEKNIWLAMEHMINRWEAKPPVQFSEWHGSEQEIGNIIPGDAGGIYLFEGPTREIGPALKVIQPGAVITTLPRPNQAFWTLSALWTGLLWGRQAASAFKVGFKRRRYDWNWFSTALHSVFKAMAPHQPLNAPFFAIIPEPEPAFLTSALTAASQAGFDLDGLVLRTRGDPAQIVWRRRAFLSGEKKSDEIDKEMVQEAIQSCLLSRGEPTGYLHLHAACLSTLANKHSLIWKDKSISYIQSIIHEAFELPNLIHYSDTSNIETGVWGIQEWENIDTLSDRVESSLVHFLSANPGTQLLTLEQHVNDEFRGLMTPAPGLIGAILGSYGRKDNGEWFLQSEDSPTSRRLEVDTAFQSLHKLAQILGYSSTMDEQPIHLLRWHEKDDSRYTYIVISSAITSRTLRAITRSTDTPVLVLPERRIPLMKYKWDHDPSLSILAEKWGIIGFQRLQTLAHLQDMTRDQWDKELQENHLEKPEQMKLL